MSRKVQFRAAVIILGLLAIILSVAGLHFLTAPPPPPPPDTPGLYVVTGDSALPYRHQPNWYGSVAGATAHINSLGFRGQEIPPQPAPGVRRLAVVGDSVVFGQRVRDDQTLSAQIESLLSQATGHTVEVINGGVRGYAARQYPAQVKKVLTLKPNLVVLVVTLVNDPELEPWRPQSDRLDQLRDSLWARLPLANVFSLPAYSSEINRLFVNHVESLYHTQGPEWKSFLDSIHRVQKITEESNTPLLVVIFPMLDRERMFEQQSRQLETALDQSGIRWVNPEQDLRALAPGQMVVSEQDAHPSAEALNRTARSLLQPTLDLFSGTTVFKKPMPQPPDWRDRPSPFLPPKP